MLFLTVKNDENKEQEAGKGLIKNYHRFTFNNDSPTNTFEEIVFRSPSSCSPAKCAMFLNFNDVQFLLYYILKVQIRNFHEVWNFIFPYLPIRSCSYNIL